MDADNVSPSVSRTRKRQSLAAGSGQAPEAYDEDASNKEKDIKRLQCLGNKKHLHVCDGDCCDWYWCWWFLWSWWWPAMYIYDVLLLSFWFIMMRGRGRRRRLTKHDDEKMMTMTVKRMIVSLIFPNRNHASISWWAMLQEKGQQTEWPKMYVHPTVGHCGKMMSYLSSGTVLLKKKESQYL